MKAISHAVSNVGEPSLTIGLLTLEPSLRLRASEINDLRSAK
jgi:hypothetical protein